jgi:hypothetical protein
MAKAPELHAYCTDEHCSIHGKDVKEMIRETEPSWLNEIKTAGSLMVLAAVIVIGNVAWYFSGI